MPPATCFEPSTDDACLGHVSTAVPRRRSSQTETSGHGKTWAHPVLSNGKLYVRDEKELLCIELGK